MRDAARASLDVMTFEPLVSGDAGTGPHVWDVAALVHAVADALAARFGAVAVRGELSGYGRAASGHSYFTLKDARGTAALRCAMFRRAASLLDFAPGDGDLRRPGVLQRSPAGGCP